MVSPSVVQSLPELRAGSGKRITESVIVGMTRSLTRARYQLIRTRVNPSGPGYITVPTEGWDSVHSRLQAVRRLMTLSAGSEGNFTYSLNTALLGGTSYPVLTAVLGTIAGVASAGAGLLFTVATTAIDASRTTQRVLARVGDELWQVEAIGRARATGLFASGWEAVHVGSYFLVDPFRSQGGSRVKGWLIHEQRTVLD